MNATYWWSVPEEGALVGALLAASAGLRTMVIEKTDLFGGTTAYSGGGLWIPLSGPTRGPSVPDSADRWASTSTPPSVRAAGAADAYLAAGPGVIADLERNPWLEFEWRPFPDYFCEAPGALADGRSIYALDFDATGHEKTVEHLRQPLPPERGGWKEPFPKVIGGRALLARLLVALSETDAVLHRATALESLVVEDGRVVGADAHSNGDLIRIGADRGVLLAAGGFERDADLRHRYQSPLGADWTLGAPGNTGGPLRAAMAAGAGTELLEECWWAPGLLLPDQTVSFRLFERGKPGASWLTARLSASPTSPGPTTVWVGPWSRVTAGASPTSRAGSWPTRPTSNATGGPPPGPDARTSAHWFDSGAILMAYDLAQLAAGIGVPAGALAHTVEEWNGMARAGARPLPPGRVGVRPFLRGSGPWPQSQCGPARPGPPYYAWKVLPADLGTKGGVRCDAWPGPSEGRYGAPGAVRGRQHHGVMDQSLLSRPGVADRVLCRLRRPCRRRHVRLPRPYPAGHVRDRCRPSGSRHQTGARSAAAIAASLEAAAGSAWRRRYRGGRTPIGSAAAARPGRGPCCRPRTATARIAAAVGVMAAEVPSRRSSRPRSALDDVAVASARPGPGGRQHHVLALKDACWAIERDRLGMARAVAELIRWRNGVRPGRTADSRRLVGHPGGPLLARPARGAGPGLGRNPRAGRRPRPRPATRRRCPAGRRRRPAVHFRRRSASPARALSFVYKAAAEIGELGDNVTGPAGRHRAPTTCCARALAGTGGGRPSLGHTRWASVGHHLRGQRPSAQLARRLAGTAGPYVVAALNGDVDNYADLRVPEGLRIPRRDHHRRQGHPDLVSRRLAEGWPLDGGLPPDRRAASKARSPSPPASAGRARRAAPGPARDGPGPLRRPGRGRLRGGQRALRPGRGDRPLPAHGRRGDPGPGRRARPGRRRRRSAGMRRLRYDGGRLPRRRRATWSRAEITTRDIDRAGFPHFLLKEITEAPAVVPQDAAGQDRRPATTGGWPSGSGDDTIPPALAPRARPTGPIRRVLVIGQGTAAVAGQAVAAAIAALPARHCRSSPLPATELSGFGLADDMSDTLVVAISQSGTTTDTNRTVDLVRTRGAHVVAIVNRRNSDLAAKVRRRALHLRRPGRRDERGVDQGVLRPGRRRLPARRRPGRRCVGRAADTAADRPDRCAPCGACPRPWSRCWPGATTIADRGARWRRPGATGRWSATAPTASPPPRCASSCPSCATSPSPATPPRTRSTSTCPASR